MSSPRIPATSGAAGEYRLSQLDWLEAESIHVIREVVAELGFSALKFDLDVPTPYMQDTASGTLSRAEIGAMVELAAAVIEAVAVSVAVSVSVPVAVGVSVKTWNPRSRAVKV